MKGIYLGDYRALAETVFERKIFVDTRDVSIAPHLLFEGRWEMWITNVMTQLLRGSLFIDVGANFGWYSLLAAHTEAKKIVAFEPNPRLFMLLSQTMLVNGIYDCDLHRKAVGDQEDRIELQVDWMRVGGATLLGERRTMEGWEGLLPETQEKIPVDVITLGSVLDELFEKQLELLDVPTVLKVDVEGFEPRVVLGAQERLRQLNCTAFVEYHADPTGECKLREMLDFFESAGYNLSHVHPDAKLKPIGRAEIDNLPQADMLCFRRFPR